MGNFTYFHPKSVGCIFWEKCTNGHKIGLGCSTPLNRNIFKFNGWVLVPVIKTQAKKNILYLKVALRSDIKRGKLFKTHTLPSQWLLFIYFLCLGFVLFRQQCQCGALNQFMWITLAFWSMQSPMTDTDRGLF